MSTFALGWQTMYTPPGSIILPGVNTFQDSWAPGVLGAPVVLGKAYQSSETGCPVGL